MSIEFHHPEWLAALFVVLLPVLRPLQTPLPYSWIELIPEDSLSRVTDWLIRLIAAGALASILFALSGPHRKDQLIEKIGNGAHIVLLLDRSASMNQNFSGRHMGGRASESKAAFAQKLLAEFIEQREYDLFAMASFSTAPIYTLGLTRDREAILSALAAASSKGRGITNMAGGLSMALDFFTDRPMTGSRIILLVSDGATRIDADTRDRLKQWFHEARVSLYWIYLRTPHSARLSERPANPNERTTPEYFLHEFFQGLEIPYQAYEADNPNALENAIRDIGRYEKKPLVYFEKTAREDFSPYCYGLAAGLLGILIALKGLEIRAARL
ncbi:MAG: vWA domain-containing protein [Gammaproteobacteria bacterium]